MVLRDHAVPRTLRIEYEGAICHVLNRGDRREPIFRDDADRKRFLETLDEACVKTDWQIHALCLMGNYFHLVVETPEGNLVEGMKWFSGHLHGAVQPAAQVVRSSVQRALQGAGGGCGSAGLLPHGVRVCALESGAGEIAEAGAIAAGHWATTIIRVLQRQLEMLTRNSPDRVPEKGNAAPGGGA